MSKRARGRSRLPLDEKLAAMAVIMPPEDIELLTREAERRDVSRSALVRRMLEDAGMDKIRKGYTHESPQ